MGFEPTTLCLGSYRGSFEFNEASNHSLEKLTSPVGNLEQLRKGYILNCKCEGKSPTTIVIYSVVIKYFLWFLHHSDFPLQANRINANHIRQFLWYLTSENHRWGSSNPSANKPMSINTVNDYYRTLRTFFNWLEREDLINTNPFSNLKPPKIQKKVIRALTVNEIQRLFKACSGNTWLDVRNKAILSIFLDSGLRLSELASLKLDDVDMNTGAILVRHGKGGKQRVVRIGSKAQKALWKYVAVYRRSDSDGLFINRFGEPLDNHGYKMVVRRLGDRVGIKVHPHQLRHTFAISFLRAGGDVFSLQYLLGHSTLAMTQRYLQSLNVDDAARAHQRFSPLDNMY